MGTRGGEVEMENSTRVWKMWCIGLQSGMSIIIKEWKCAHEFMPYARLWTGCMSVPDKLETALISAPHGTLSVFLAHSACACMISEP